MWSAPSTQHVKRFFKRLITSTLLFGALLSHATANTFECLLGTDNRYGTYTLTASNVNVSTPAETCEKLFATVPPYITVRKTVVSLFPNPDNFRSLNLWCVGGVNQAVVDQIYDQVVLNLNDDPIYGAFSIINGGCSCGTGIAYSNVSGTEAGCKTTEKKLFVTLTPVPQSPSDPRPKGTEGKDPKSSTLELIAKVTENGSPKAGVAVTFAVEPIANSGGHDHHDASRPKGTVTPNNPNTPVTDANGEIKATFQASEFAGTHVVAAACSSCTNTSVTKNVDVKVPNLTQLTGGGSGSLYKLIGEDGNHGSNHWFSHAAKAALIQLLSIFKESGWGVVGVNDSSLIWGGCFDVSGRWGLCNNNHAGHRTGEEVDLSFYRPSGVSKDLRKKIYDDLKDSHKIEMPTILWHVNDKPNPDPTKPPLSYAHFHVYLMGQKQFNKTPY